MTLGGAGSGSLVSTIGWYCRSYKFFFLCPILHNHYTCIYIYNKRVNTLTLGGRISAIRTLTAGPAGTRVVDSATVSTVIRHTNDMLNDVPHTYIYMYIGSSTCKYCYNIRIARVFNTGIVNTIARTQLFEAVTTVFRERPMSAAARETRGSSETSELTRPITAVDYRI